MFAFFFSGKVPTRNPYGPDSTIYANFPCSQNLKYLLDLSSNVVGEPSDLGDHYVGVSLGQPNFLLTCCWCTKPVVVSSNWAVCSPNLGVLPLPWSLVAFVQKWDTPCSSIIWCSWIIIQYHWVSLIITTYHWLSLLIIKVSLIVINYHWVSLIIIDYH